MLLVVCQMRKYTFQRKLWLAIPSGKEDRFPAVKRDLKSSCVQRSDRCRGKLSRARMAPPFARMN